MTSTTARVDMFAGRPDVPARHRLNVLLVIGFVAIVILFGGGSRADTLSLPVVRIVALLTAAVALLQIDRARWEAIRWPTCFLVVAAAAIAVQLVPLPSAAWAALPGRERYTEMLALAGVMPTWRPISLTPDLTWNSFLAILPPMALLLGVGLAGSQALRLLLPMLLVGIGLHALLGLVQYAGGGPYFYAVTNLDAAVGLFANRNHLAVFVAMALPLLGLWSALPHPSLQHRRTRLWLSLCVAAAIIPFLLMIGSRAGLLVAITGAVLSVPLFLRGFGAWGTDHQRAKGTWLLALVPLAVGFGSVLAARGMGRDLALRRLIDVNGGTARADNFPIYLEMLWDHFPFGSGFGSFDPVFRGYEPLHTLDPTYLNHAHNDLIQLIIEGGLPALLLALTFIIWFVWRAWRLAVDRVQSSASLYGQAGAIIILQLLLASAVDYPLRTPLLGIVFVVAALWMLPGRTGMRSPAAD